MISNINDSRRNTTQAEDTRVYEFHNPQDYGWSSCGSTLQDLEREAEQCAFRDMLLRSIHEWEMSEKCRALEALRKQHGESAELVILAKPNGVYKICTLTDVGEYMEDHNLLDENQEMAFDGMLLVGYDPVNLVCLKESSYLHGPIIIYGLDTYGEVCGIDTATLITFLETAPSHMTVLEVDGKKYPVFRLD